MKTTQKPFIVFVDLNHNLLLRRDKTTLGKITQASDDYFISEWEDKDTKHRFVIDRKLGTYEWNFTLLEPKPKKYYGVDGVVNWGKCEKTNVEREPKF